MKKLLALVLALILALSMVACNGADNAGNTDGDGQTNTDNGGNGDTTPTKTTPTSLTINGAALADYTIIYAYNPDRATYQAHSDLVTQDTEYDKQTAEYLAAELKEHFGVTVAVARDADKAASDKEIIVGKTSRGLVDATLDTFDSVKDFSVRENNGKLVFCGASYGATWHAVDEFVADCLAQDAATADVKSGYNLKKEANMLVVGCIGDSLTNGSSSAAGNNQGNINSSDVTLRRAIVAYPAVLQRLAWKDLVVYNYGLGGRTMLENFIWQDGSGNHAWNACQYYTECMNNAKNIDLALVMLGTNDANKDRATASGFQFGGASYKAKFIESYKNIVDDLKEKNPEVRVALLNCPKSYHSFELNMNIYIRPYQKAAAQQVGTDLLDMYTYTANNLVPADFPDGLHPSDKGYTKFAEGIYGLATPIINELLGK